MKVDVIGSGLPSDQRYSIAIVRPSSQPSAASKAGTMSSPRPNADPRVSGGRRCGVESMDGGFCGATACSRPVRIGCIFVNGNAASSSRCSAARPLGRGWRADRLGSAATSVTRRKRIRRPGRNADDSGNPHRLSGGGRPGWHRHGREPGSARRQRSLGLTIPESFLSRADEVIE